MLEAMPDRIAIIANGRFRGHRLLEVVAQRLGHSPFYTDRPRHAEVLAATINPDVGVVVVAGGDGTVHEVVNGLMQRAPERRPLLAILPMGTGNDVARALQIKRSVKDLFLRLENHHPVAWDVIRLQYTDLNGEPETRYCINVADVGFGGEVTRVYSDRLRQYPFGLGYLVASFRGFMSARPVHAQVVTPMQQREQTTLMVAIANSKWFGRGIGIAPPADPTDGLIDLTLVGDVTTTTYVRFLPRLLRARSISDHRIEYLRTRSVEITSPTAMPLEIDGEYSGYTPVKADVVPLAIKFLV